MLDAKSLTAQTPTPSHRAIAALTPTPLPIDNSSANPQVNTYIYTTQIYTRDLKSIIVVAAAACLGKANHSRIAHQPAKRRMPVNTMQLPSHTRPAGIT